NEIILMKPYEDYIEQFNEALITLLEISPSIESVDDLESEVDQIFDISGITKEDILQNTQHFIGEIQQQPPIFSALKKDGKRLYEYAREGEHVEIPKRAITINEFKITNIDIPNVEFRVVCSKGTYIRSLAHDFGKMLNNGAHLSSLRRTKIGDFSVDNAVGVLAFEEAFKTI
ncbi:MAG: tRNA pseudouridine(55) synthase, partial [Flavobacteriaceae bacterium]|nr:tRNA pseudouridine(55) synthase [Flavobacteriaceae bacterium]